MRQVIEQPVFQRRQPRGVQDLVGVGVADPGDHALIEEHIPDLLRPAAMANLLGDLWGGGEPDWAAACRFTDVKLHLYGKGQARAGRKMGHINRVRPLR